MCGKCTGSVMKITHTITGNFVKIFFNGKLHLCFLQNKLTGLQSYKMTHNWYCVDLHVNGVIIRLEYFEKQLWEAMLKKLDEVIL